MTPHFDRRSALAMLTSTGLAGCVGGQAQGGAAGPAAARAIAELERTNGGRLGAFMLDTGDGAAVGWRENERFAMCSTFKTSLAALLLREIDAGRIDPAETLPFSAADLLPNSPVTGAHAEAGRLGILPLAEAIQKVSDNLAANLLLRRVGGPEALTRFWRSLGDQVSRLDNYEPELNRVYPGEVHDTTSPRAMAGTLAGLLTGPVLAAPSRFLLRRWMDETTTGLRRIRSALPSGWRAGDKTGNAAGVAGMANQHNDLAIVLPPGRAPLIVVAFLQSPGTFENQRPEDEAALAQVGAIAAQWALARWE